MAHKIDITGQKYGRLTALKEVPSNNKGTMWMCRCDCGNIKTVYLGHLRMGRIKSCGCLQNEARIENKTTHGCSNTRMYSIWESMKQRCHNPKNHAYPRYGGRGIHVCAEWGAFDNFKRWAEMNGYQDDLTLDRIDNDLGYSPSNCRWITMKEQQSNRRNNRFMTLDGITMTLQQWSESTGISADVICSRIKNGWSVDRAIKTPTRKMNRRCSS